MNGATLDNPHAFSATYKAARAKFLDACDAANLTVQSHPHPLPGRDGEALAMDVALDGSKDANKLLMITSGCHGVEGYCGSGVQVHALRDAAWREAARAQGVAVLYIHALNPYGFSHLRRVTNENVDLNRNFHDFTKPLPVNTAYREIAHLLLPQQWPPTLGNRLSLLWFVLRRGKGALKDAASRGQSEFADGVFYGGQAPTWSNLTLRKVLREHAQQAQHIGWIDVHTGLGSAGHGERIANVANMAHVGGDNNSDASQAILKRARQWWGNEVTSILDGSTVSSPLTGVMPTVMGQECPQAQYTGIALEFGTVPVRTVMQALRAEHWLHQHPQAPAAQAAQIKQDLLDAFYVQTDEWKQQILTQSLAAMHEAVAGLSAR
jgi:Protein of unknown function (DUF2817)